MSASLLYIEDNEQNFYLVSYLLGARGHRVTWATDGDEGLRAALESRPELILLDIQLPGRDGLAIARELRAHEALAVTPIIALTSYAMRGDRERALAAGCTGYLQKPIDPATFVGQIEAYLADSAERE